jgi:hypothetical protein
MNTTLDVYGFLNGTVNNVATKFFFDTFKSSLPLGLIHPCPYFGEIKAYNLTLNAFSLAMQFMMGSYRAVARFYDEKDDNIFKTHLFVDMKQSHYKNRRHKYY